MPRGKQSKAVRLVNELNLGVGAGSINTTAETRQQQIQAAYGNSSPTQTLHNLLINHKILRIFEVIVLWQYEPQLEILTIVKRGSKNIITRFTKNYKGLPEDIRYFLDYHLEQFMN